MAYKRKDGRKSNPNSKKYTSSTDFTRQLNHKKEMYLSILAKHLGIISYACKEMGMSRRTVYNWIRDDKEFAARVKDVELIQGDLVERKLMQLIDKGNPRATVFYAATKLKTRGYTNKIELSTPEPIRISTEGTVIHEVRNSMPDKVLIETLKKLKDIPELRDIFNPGGIPDWRKGMPCM